MKILFLAYALLTSTVVPLSFAELKKVAPVVILGRVTSSSSAFEEDGRIYTRYILEILDTLRGERSKEIVVRSLGGVAGEFGQRVEGAPRFQNAHDYVLFLAADSADTYAVVGLWQGAFEVDKDRLRPFAEDGPQLNAKTDFPLSIETLRAALRR